MKGQRVTRLLMVVTLIGLLVCGASAVAADQQYACNDQTCTFSVPDSYTLASNDPSQIIFQDSVSGGSFSLAVQDGSSYNSLDEAVNALLGQVYGADGYQADPAGVQSPVLGGNPGRSFSYISNNSSGTKVEQAVFASIYHGKLYLVIFSTTPENEAAFLSGAQGVFQSWTFV